jgi:ribosomal protein S5
MVTFSFALMAPLVASVKNAALSVKVLLSPADNGIGATVNSSSSC